MEDFSDVSDGDGVRWNIYGPTIAEEAEMESGTEDEAEEEVRNI